MTSRSSPTRSVWPGIALGTRIAIALLSLVVLVASGVIYARFRQFQADVPTVTAIDPSQRPKVDIDGKDQNILITGNDNRDSATDAQLAQLGTTRDGGSLNTDTMMILHVPADGRKAAAISFPRDSWVNIPGYGMDRLNAAYPDAYNNTPGTVLTKESAGSNLLVRTLQNLTGLTIDHYAQVDLIGFFLISNAIQGVDVCLLRAQQDDYSGIDLKAGWNHIQGRQALAFVRQRHGLPRSDLDRIVRQQYFLSAVFRKVTAHGTLLNPLLLNRLLGAVSQSITVDRTVRGHAGLNLLDLARQMQSLSAGNLTFTQIPTAPTTINGNDVLIIDTAGMKARIAAVIAVTVAVKSRAAIPASRPAAASTTAAQPTPGAASTPAAASTPDVSTAAQAGCIN